METFTADLRKASLATRAVFLVCGIALSGWAPMVPYVKDKLLLNDSEIGALLLFLGVGAIVMMPATGWLISRIGSRRVILLATIIIAVTLPSLLLMDSPVRMGMMLFLFGAGIGSVDVAMNAHGVQVQNLSGKPVMSSLHGLFSVGGLLGPVLVLFLLKMDFQPVTSLLMLSVLLVLIVSGQSGNLMSFRTEKEVIRQYSSGKAEEKQKPASWLSTRVLFLGTMCFIVFLSEGAVLDWSAIFLRDYKGMDEAFLALGYAAFSIAMAFMRLIGDRLVSRMHSRKVILAGSLAAASGFLVLIATPWIASALLGFVLIGLGAANIVPVFFSEAGQIKNVPGTAALAAVTTIGYAGQLAGPALLGVIAEETSLSVALGFTGALMLVVALSHLSEKRNPG
ncbi:MAG: MFS transporter [Cytophagaceae bacterium SCN 52-12]|nr:MAG: MFS transporter [Cytophagaceae bacterium SCN 52-12]